jgi:glycine oxidase
MNHLDFVIFGAGLSGLPMARQLGQQGHSVLLIDPYAGANHPEAPAGLVNPATGKRARPGWRIKSCYQSLRSQLEFLSHHAGGTELYRDSGVLRPALNNTLAENFIRSLQEYDWPEGWVQWLDSGQMARTCPEIAPSYGGLHVRAGYTVYVEAYLRTYRKWLQQQGCLAVQHHATYELPATGQPFRIHFKDAPDLGHITADQVIVAAGPDSIGFSGWENLGVHLVKGEAVLFESESPLPWNSAVSAMGYSLRIGTNLLLAGSTYEHQFHDREITEDAYERIAAKVNMTFPGQLNKLTRKMQVAGVRVTTPNRLPVIGRHPKQERLHIYTGMNSTGLLYSEYVAELLAGHITRGEDIPDELNVSRLSFDSE